ncbi:hypothetical protein MIMGU_mgv1a019393mg [Erythranthe guttata]|uniref:F-box domain-containing protein n=1 Tax=Erythranthe guttata TaxID=4155 RepID=A0A022QYM5_ERYGU|nr:hypothetical protein MIMGU_mgv1a019393mg [Erythranthe guttata]
MASSSSNIPFEIIEIILSKSPSVKSLLRFKSVCKSWNTIISDPVFVRYHLENSPNNLFLSTKRPRFEGGYPLFKLDGRKFRAADAYYMKYYVNVTAYYVLLGNSRFHYSEKHVLWNPSTRREMYIECPYAYNEAYKLNYGICYDRLTDDFKVVLVIDDRYAIYSCKNNSWSEKKLGIKYYGFFTGIFVDGATYWVLRDDKHTIQIVYFDPRTDELKGLQKPEQLNSDCNSGLTISVACLRENMCLRRLVRYLEFSIDFFLFVFFFFSSFLAK